MALSRGLSALETINLSAGGQITLDGGAVDGLTSLSTFSATSGGNMTVVNGSVYGTSAESISLISGGSLSIGSGSLSDNVSVTSIVLESEGALVVDSGAGTTNYALESLDISSGGTTTITDGAFTYTQLNDLAINSVGDLTIGPDTFQFGQLTSLTFPSSLVLIGNSAFMGNPLSAVYLSSTPTIEPSAFSYAGVSYDPIGNTYSGLDQVMYVPLYVSVPNSYTNTNHADVDLDSDSTDDIAGGYLINPAQISLNYEDGKGDAISSQIFALGELADNTPLITYRVSDNPTEDLESYYFIGDQFTFSAPVIDGYSTPADQTVTLHSGLNTVNFIYALNEAQPEPGVPNTGLAPFKENTPLALIAAGVFMIGLVITVGGLRHAARSR